MKSKNPKIQKTLKKGQALILLFILMFSSLSSFHVVFADNVLGNEIGNEIGNQIGNEIGNQISGEDDDIEDDGAGEGTLEEWLSANPGDYTSDSVDINAAIEQYGLINYEAFKNKVLTSEKILIEKESDLRALSIYVAEGNTSKGKTFELTKDIVLTSNEWTPIGNSSNAFNGNFDGKGYTISNIIISKKQSYAGLFGKVEGYKVDNVLIKPIIKNVIIGESNINMDLDITSKYLSDVKADRNVFYSHLGAVVGRAINTTISNCKNTANVLGGQCVGGIAGYVTDTNIDNCYNSGTIEGFKSVGGIVGSYHGNGYYDSTQTNKEDKNYSIDRCKNTGLVVGILGNTGGIAGVASKYSTVKNCSNSGDVLSSEEKEGKYYVTNGVEVIFKSENIGGIVGWASSDGTIEKNKAEGDVFILNCINEASAEVRGYQDVGGIAGQLAGYTGGVTWAKYCIDYSEDIIATDPTNFSAGKIAGCVGAREVKEAGAREVISVGIIQDCYYILSDGDKTNVNFYKDSTRYAVKQKGLSNVIRGYGYAMRTKIENGKEVVYNYLDNIDNGNPNVNDIGSSAMHGSSNMIKMFVDDNGKYGYIEVAAKSIDNNPENTINIVKNIGDTTGAIKYASTDVSTSKVVKLATGNSVQIGTLDTDKKFVQEDDIDIESTKSIDFVRTLLDAYNCTISGNAKDGYSFVNNNVVVANNGKISIDGLAPQIATETDSDIKDVKVFLNGSENEVDKPVLVKAGDKVTIKIKFNEKINAGVKPILSVATPVSSSSTRYATYVGLDGDTITYTYTVKGDETVSLGTGMKLSGSVQDIFGNRATNFDETISLENDVSIINAQDSITVTTDDGLIAYTLSGFTKGNDGKLYYNKNSTINVIATFNQDLRKNASITNSEMILNIVIDGEDNPIQITNIFSENNIGFIKAINGDEIFENTNNKAISEIFLTTDYVVYKGTEETGAPLGKSNTGAELNNIFIDTIAANINQNSIDVEASYSKENGKYSVGEEILISLTTTEPIDARLSKVPTVKAYFGSKLGKFNNGKAVFLEVITNTNEKTKEVDSYTFKYRYVIQPGDEGVFGLKYKHVIETDKLVDVAGNETRLDSTIIEKNIIVADTIAPTVAISAKKVAETTKTDILNNVTNADIMEYTFAWSEEVVGFTPEDITVNGGEISKNADATAKFNKVGNTNSYTLEVIPSVESGNVGEVQVIVEQNICTDAVGQGNVRSENILTVDKDAPTQKTYNVFINEEKTEITVEAIFDEAIESIVEGNELSIIVGDSVAAGSLTTPEVSGDKVTYKYNVSGADGGNVDITLIGKVKDIAGNESEELNVKIDNDIVLEKHVIESNSVEYSFSKKCSDESDFRPITDFSTPTYFKAGDKIKVTVDGITSYEYTVVKGNNGHMKKMTVIPAQEETEGSVSFSSDPGTVDISAANIYFDTTAPTVELSATIEESVANNIYAKGKEIIIIAKTNEEITNKDQIPEINVSFSESGIGKYNYQTESGKGNAKYVETIVNEDKSISWKYKYVVTEGDEGEISLEYANSNNKVIDLAGNETSLIGYPEKSNTSISVNDLTNKDITGKETKVSYEFYKGNTKITDFSNNTYYKKDDTIKVVAKFTNGLYSAYGSTNTSVDNSTAPQFKIDGKEFTANVNNNKEITYTYKVINDSNEKLDGLELKFNTTLYAKRSSDNNYDTISGTKTLNISNANLYIYNNGTVFNGNNIKVDTGVPTVEISAKKVDGITKTDILNNVTNANTLEYTFTWNEEVVGFTPEDITVNGGEISKNADGTAKFNKVGNTNSYTLEVIPAESTEKVQVIVEKNACQDVVGHENVRSESVIRIDKIAPILIGLEAYGTSNINVENIDSVKEKYNEDETVTIVATFSENIEGSTAPALALQFSESGNAKGTVLATEIKENKITYTYTITAGEEGAPGDTGTLSVKGFSGTVIDKAGNTTQVTKRELNGDTIIADTTAPELVKLTAIAPDFEYDELLQDGEIKRYGVSSKTRTNNTITIIAEYSENVYNLNLSSNHINNIPENNNDSTLTLEFGNKSAKGALTSRVEGNKVYYTYDITNGDNGDLSIASLERTVSDIAGNSYSTNGATKLPELDKYETEIKEENKVDVIKADTTKPTISLAVTGAVDKYSDGNTITGNTENNKNYYREGSIITVTVTSNEYIYNNTNKALSRIDTTIANAKKPTIKFGGIAGKEENFVNDNTTVEYASNETTITYTYVVGEGDNGELSLEFAANQYSDIALNNNVAETKREANIVADTINPYIAENTNVVSNWEITDTPTLITAVGRFSETLYVMSNEYVLSQLSSSNISEAPVMGVFANGQLQGTATASITNNNGQTTLTYVYDATEIDVNPGEKPSVNIIDGTLYDRAGNIWSLEIGSDMSSPKFQNIQVLTEPGYYNAGDKLEIIAKFQEITGLTTVPKLTIKIRDVEKTLTGTYDKNDELNTATTKVVRYEYPIVDENGPLNIVSLIGTVSDGTRDNAVEKYYISAPEGKTLANPSEVLASNGSTYVNTEDATVIVDTTKPIVDKVEVKNNTAKYIRENAEKKEEFATGRTNSDIVEYIVTFNEAIKVVDESKVRLLNGEKVEIIPYDSDRDGYYEKFSIITKPTIEGVQSLLLDAGLVEDRAGNNNDDFRFNGLTTDFTEPTVIFISEYNGGIYVLPTNVKEIELRPNVEIKEEIKTIKFKWLKSTDDGWVNVDSDKDVDDEGYAEVTDYSLVSDIAIDAQSFGEGNYKLSIKVEDKAGNVTIVSKEYSIRNSKINIVAENEGIADNATNKVPPTNGNVLVTVTFGDGLTDNRKVLFRPNGSTLLEELTIEDGKYKVEENGIIYVEATDRVGNKVYNGREINNIDKELPFVTVELNEANLVIAPGQDNATIKTKVNTTDNMTESVDVKYLFSTSDEAPVESLITNSLNNGEAIITNATRGTYYLYVLATDDAGNKTLYPAGPYTVFDANPRTHTDAVTGEIINDDPTITMDNLIKFEREGKFVNISYNNFTETEGYKDIIREKSISLTNPEDGDIDYENYSYVEVNGATTITVIGKDACGNEVVATFEVTRDMLEGPEINIYGNPKDWTNQNVKLEVDCYEELSELTVEGKIGETTILERTNILESREIEISQNGTYTFVATDIYGNSSTKEVKVEKIDKAMPEISDVVSDGKTITITATDDGSGIAGYAITNTTEVPVEWSKSKVIKVTEDGIFYVWAKDNAGNIRVDEEVVVVDTTAPTITFNYTSISVEAGLPIQVSVNTDEEAIISYSWDGKTWVDSKELLTSVKVSKEYSTTGVYTLYAKAEDKFGNETRVKTIEFSVVMPEEIDVPEIIFDGLPMIQVDGVHYVKVAADMTTEDVTNKMKKEALCGVTPEYKNLTEDNKFKTGSEITLAGETKYIVVVNGDVNCDGKVAPLDVTLANRIRLNKVSSSTIQKLAADFDLDGIVKAIDITMINRYRLGKIKGI